MLKNNLIIIPYNLPYNWVCDHINQTEMVLRNNNFVISFFWNDAPSLKEFVKYYLLKKNKFLYFKKINSKSLYMYPINFLPFKRFIGIQKINLSLNIFLLNYYLAKMKDIKSLKRILWIFGPEQHFLINKFNEDISLYDCVDFYSSMIDSENTKIAKKEKSLIKKVDIIFVNSPALYKLKRKINQNVYQVPQGCSQYFLKKTNKNKPGDLKRISKPIIGFCGSIDYRLDYNLIIKLVKSNPNWSFVFIGPEGSNLHQDQKIQLQKVLTYLKKLNNTYFIGKKTKKQIINYLKFFDIGLIPYNIKLHFCRYSYPMKVFEYFARGKPVISTPIESLIPLRPYVQIAKDSKEFSQQIARILKSGWPKEYIKRQKKLALQNSWKNKIKKISAILKKKFPEKFND